MPAYQQGKQAGPDAFKLSSNENPFDPLPAVTEALAGATSINRYPDASAARLRAALGERFGVPADHVHVAAGSVSILAQLVQATSAPGDEVIFAWRSFEAYPWLATVAGAVAVPVPLTQTSEHDLDAMAEAVTNRTRAIIVCTPNNPTGPIVTRDAFLAFLGRVPSDVLVILDEAYAEFVTDQAAINGLAPVIFREHPNVVVLRTFAKAYGLAALRRADAIGDPRLLQGEEAALASLTPDAEDELVARVAEISERRDRLAAGLREVGWAVPEAQGNFVWLPSGADTARVAAAFDEAGLIVRPFIGDGVRISVGEEASVEKVLRVAASVVEGLPQ